MSEFCFIFSSQRQRAPLSFSSKVTCGLPLWHRQLSNSCSCLTKPILGPVTDYGSTMVHWMRNRQPRYKGGYQGEMERPSASYIIDVRPMPPPADLFNVPHLTAIDATTTGKTSPSRRLSTCPTLTLLLKQDQTSSQCCEMDTRRPPITHSFQQWRIHPLEWHWVQFRDDHAST